MLLNGSPGGGSYLRIYANVIEKIHNRLFSNNSAAHSPTQSPSDVRSADRDQ